MIKYYDFIVLLMKNRHILKREPANILYKWQIMLCRRWKIYKEVKRIIYDEDCKCLDLRKGFKHTLIRFDNILKENHDLMWSTNLLLEKIEHERKIREAQFRREKELRE